MRHPGDKPCHAITAVALGFSSGIQIKRPIKFDLYSLDALRWIAVPFDTMCTRIGAVTGSDQSRPLGQCQQGISEFSRSGQAIAIPEDTMWLPASLRRHGMQIQQHSAAELTTRRGQQIGNLAVIGSMDLAQASFQFYLVEPTAP